MNDSLQLALVDNGFTSNSSNSSQCIKDIDNLDLVIYYCKIKDREHLKDICRTSNWSPLSSVRSKLWSVLSSHYKTTNSIPDFSEIDDFIPFDDAPHKLPSFVDPNFCRFFRLNLKGRRIVEKVLWALAKKHGEITICPLLYPMAALFLHYLSVEDTLISLTYILAAPSGGMNGTDVRSLLSQSKRELEYEAYILLRLTNKLGFFPRRKFYKKQRANLNKNKEINCTFRHWLQWIFIGLPFNHLIRIIDCFLVEGTKFLYRIGLALLLLYWKDKRKTNPNAFKLDTMLEFCQNIRITPSELIRLSINLNGLSMARINKLYKEAKSCPFKMDPLSGNMLPNIFKRDSLSAGSVESSPRHSEMISLSSVKITETLRMPPRLQSSILDRWGLEYIWEWLPERLLVKQASIIYCSSIDGVSLNTFYGKVERYGETVLLVKTLKDEVFGAFCSSPWSDRHKNRRGINQYFGTGETFLFSLKPVVAHYPWVGDHGYYGNTNKNIAHTAQLFMSANQKMISIGAGSGIGLYLDENLTRGKSETCDTFCNKPLASTNDFECSIVEVIGFVS